MRHSAPIIACFAVMTTFSGATPQGVPANVYLGDPGDGATTTVQLERLTGSETRLEGRYARVTSEKLSANGDALEGIGGKADFRYEPNTDALADCTWHVEDCSAFDAVNVYYHIDRFAQEFWVDRMGVEIAFQVTAVTHYPGEGAYANLPPGTIKFGLGTTMMKNAALDPDIIQHEYTHLVTSSLGFEVDIESPVEMRAINEGVAHYFVASFTDDPRIGEWVVTCPPRRHCTGPENDTEMASLSTDPAVWNWNNGRPSDRLQYGACTRFYPLDGKCKIGYHNFTDVYTWGMIWSSALWDLRESIGASAADRLILESIASPLSAGVRFAAAVEALLEADRRLFSDQHQMTIKQVFSRRGFPVPGIVQSEPLEVPARAASLRMFGANPVATGAQLQIELGFAAESRLAVYDPLGRRVALLHSGVLPPGRHDFTWSADSSPAGRYFAVFTADSYRESVAVTVIR